MLCPFWKITLRCIRPKLPLWSQPQPQLQREAHLRTTSELSIFRTGPLLHRSTPLRVKVPQSHSTPSQPNKCASFLWTQRQSIMKSYTSCPQTSHFYPPVQVSQTVLISNLSGRNFSKLKPNHRLTAWSSSMVSNCPLGEYCELFGIAESPLRSNPSIPPHTPLPTLFQPVPLLLLSFCTLFSLPSILLSHPSSPNFFLPSRS